MKIMHKILAVFILMSLAFSASAGRQVGEITGFVAFESGGVKKLTFKLVNNVSGGCNTTARYTFDESLRNFDLMASTILSAYHAKSLVQVEYFESCNAWSNAYDVRYICVGDINC